MGADDEHRSGSLETYPALDAYYRVADVAVAPDGVGGTYLLHFLYRLDFVVESLAVDGAQFALLKAELQHFGTLFRDVLEVSTLRQSLRGVEYLSAADACPPDSNVVAVLQFREIGEVAVGVQVVYFLLAGEVLVAGQSDDLYSRSLHEEGHVETYLVVAGAC